MFYNYAELEDGTQLAFSNVLDGGEVQVSIKRPVELGFDSAMCTLPAFEWSEIEGFDDADIARLRLLCPQQRAADSATCSGGIEGICLGSSSSEVSLSFLDG